MRSFKKKILSESITILKESLEVVTSVARDEAMVAERLPGNLKHSVKYDTMISGSRSLQLAATQISLAIKRIMDACS